MDASFEQPAPRTSEVFLTLKTVGEEDRISLGQLTGLLGDRAFGLLVLIFAGPWLVRELMEYTENLIMNIPLLIG